MNRSQNLKRFFSVIGMPLIQKSNLNRIIFFLLSILWITIKRIVKNWRLLGALLIGLILVASFCASVPIYTAAALQASFLNHWRLQDDFRPPFTLIITHRNTRRENNITSNQLNNLKHKLDKELTHHIGQPALSNSFYGSFGNDFVLLDEERPPTGRTARAEFSYLSNLQDHAVIETGRWFKTQKDGILEIVVDEKTLDDLELIIGKKYMWAYSVSTEELTTDFKTTTYNGQQFLLIPFKVVGIFAPLKGTTSREWIYPPLPNRLFMLPSKFFDLQNSGLRVSNYDLQWVFDDREVRVDQLDSLINELENLELKATQIASDTKYWHSPLSFFKEFKVTLDQVSLFLLALAAPTLALILIYISLIASLAVERRANEISVLSSRGAGKAQVLFSFFIEWSLLAMVATIIGPHLGEIIGKWVGLAQGFLEFTPKNFLEIKQLPIQITKQSRSLALIGTTIAIIAALIPVIYNSRLSIVTLRQIQTRTFRSVFWHRYFLDVIILALSFYGYSKLKWQSSGLATNSTVDADPVLFLLPIGFFLGSGLLLLRLYPLLLKGFSWFLNHASGVILQLTFFQLSRNFNQYISFVILLLLTVAMGIYNGATAKTLLTNFEHVIRYKNGADLVVRESWTPPDLIDDLNRQPITSGRGYDQPRPTAESEPPFLPRLEFEGVQSASRVFVRRSTLSTKKSVIGNSITMMAIYPHEFGKTSWFRSDMFSVHFYEYLKQLGKHREGVLLNTNLMENKNIKLGDNIYIWYDNQLIEAYVVGSLSYWPTLDPSQRPFAILNLDYVQDQIALEPYDSWYNISSNQYVRKIIENLTTIGVYADDIIDTERTISNLHREPYRQGFFGIITIGFVSACIVAFMAYLVYTIYSMRLKAIQFGALRANGLSLIQILLIISLEQLLTIGIGIGIGVGVGNLATKLFLPFFRDRATEIHSVPPFLIFSNLTNNYEPALIIGGTFLLSTITFSYLLLKKKIVNTIRLGEEN